MASVLVIDDYAGTLETYSTILRLAGFEVATASNGRAGIDLATSRAFDVHLVDLRLPDLSGIEVVRELKLGGMTRRVVIVTVFAAFESAFDAAAAGADGYVDGMLFGDEVVEVVTRALAGPFPVRHPGQRRAEESPEAPKVVVASPSGIDLRVREVMRVIDAGLAASHSVADLATGVEWSESSLLRGPVVGRKNHYGSRSMRGTYVAALFYTLCETAKLVGIDPHADLLRALSAASAKPGAITYPDDLLSPQPA